MYEDLINKLRYCGNAVSCLHCPYWAGCAGSKEDLIEAADAIEELSRDLDYMNDANIALYGALPQWIPVTERLPDDGAEVLAFSISGFAYVDWWIDGKWKVNSMVDGKYEFVTHWMPLPEAPKDGE